jgi:hypothetical protein
MSEPAALLRIEYVSSLDDVDPENDNLDVQIFLTDGQVYSLVVGTPRNVERCVENEQIEYFFGTPFLFVSRLDKAHIEQAVCALLSEDQGKWLDIYGTIQK